MTSGAGRGVVRVAILDDHEVLLDGFTGWIAGHAPDLEVVVAATSWLQLVRDAAFPAELVFLDLQPRDPVSIEARVRTCRAAGAIVIVLAGSDTPEARERALAAGAAALLPKSLPIAELVDVARDLIARRGAAEQLWRPARSFAATPPRPRLSPGELTALRLYADGLSTVQVAERMGVRFETAKTYRRRVRRNYAAAGRPAGRKVELIRRAAEDGILE
jgi:DNA-binding NarL/FixJ family response regulator